MTNDTRHLLIDRETGTPMTYWIGNCEAPIIYMACAEHEWRTDTERYECVPAFDESGRPNFSYHYTRN